MSPTTQHPGGDTQNFSYFRLYLYADDSNELIISCHFFRIDIFFTLLLAGILATIHPKLNDLCIFMAIFLWRSVFSQWFCMRKERMGHGGIEPTTRRTLGLSRAFAPPAFYSISLLSGGETPPTRPDFSMKTKTDADEFCSSSEALTSRWLPGEK